MTLRELLSTSRSYIKVLHGGRGCIVAFPLKADKHERYLDIEPIDIWASFEVKESGFDRVVTPVICCFISTHDYQMANKGEMKK